VFIHPRCCGVGRLRRPKNRISHLLFVFSLAELKTNDKGRYNTAALVGSIISYFGLRVLVNLLAVIINSLSETSSPPMVMRKGLSISPTIVFISFIFWIFILGAAGAFLAMPLTVALILFMNSFEETRGLAAIMGTTPL